MKKIIQITLYCLLITTFTSAQNIDLIRHIQNVIDSVKSLRNNDPAYAILLGKKAVETADSIYFRKGKADLLDEIGVNYKKLADYKTALNYHNEALNIYKDLSDSVGISFALSNIGNVYRQLQDNESALLFYKNSLAIKKALKDELQISYTLNKIGMVQCEIGEYATAVFNFNEVIRINKKLNNINLIGSGYNNLGTLELKRGNYEKARVYLMRASEIYATLDNTFGNAEILYKLAELAYKTKKYQRAISQSKKSIKMAETSSSKIILLDNYKLLSEVYAKINNYKQAYFYEQKLTDIKDTILNEEQNNKLNLYKTLYQIERAESENQLLKLENTSQKHDLYQQKIFRNWLILFSSIIAIAFGFVVYQFFLNKKKSKKIEQQNYKLEKLNKEMSEINQTKDKLLSIIGHDIRNPFSSVLGFSDLLYQDFEDLSEDDLKYYISKIYSSSRNVNNIIENILSWSKTHRDKIKLRILDMELYIVVEEVFCNIEHMFNEKQIELKKNFSNHFTLKADIFMLSTIITNVLTNAIKFSNKQSVITIDANTDENYSNIIIIDEGVGMTQEKADSLFRGTLNESEYGTDSEKGVGIGLMICRDFVQAHNGKIAVESKLNEGTKIILSFPN